LPAIIFVVLLAYLPTWQGKGPEVHPLTKSWEVAIPNQQVPAGLTSLSARACGACHQQHYAEWQVSTHAQAWHDQQFQAEIKKETSPFMCINCHTPLQNQQEYKVTGLLDGDLYRPVKEKNPAFDPSLQQEGITCASCHVRDGAVIGTTGNKNAPHKTVKDPEFLSEKLCISCHNATAILTPELVCTFETGDEWQAGPFFGEKNCISCHMAEEFRENVPGAGKALSHQHYFAGSGIPKHDTLQTKGLNGLVFYPSSVAATLPAGEELRFSLKVKNELAGHRVPTGDPERYFLITLELKNPAGKVLASQTERIGEKWQWYPEAKKLADNNLYPGEERTYVFNYLPQATGILILNLTVTKHRLAPEFAEYNKLDDSYPLFITIYEKSWTVAVKSAS